MVVGGPAWSPEDCGLAVDVAERLGLPVCTSWRRKDRFDNGHAHYAGELGLGACPPLLEAVREADLLLVVGARLSENQTHGYDLFDQDWAAERLVHLCADPMALGRVWQPRLAVHAAIGPSLRAMMAFAPRERGEWVGRMAAIHRDWATPTEVEAGVNPAQVIRTLHERLGPEAIITSGAGNFASWVHRFSLHRRPRTQVAPASGAMAYGVPTAIAASLLNPGRPVVGISGDGDFLMAAGELATVVHEGATPIFLVFDNGQYGTIRMHQAKEFPGRPSATALTNPDFAALARSFGLHAETVRETGAFATALDRAVGKAALIHILMDRQEIAPGRRLPDGP
jgi:acetolactate synthase-1/2/3 large subunit